ncbi:FHA domain-containing protein [Mesorhizobium sp. CGMCC 1.15528]|uniref:FHA domain-containing protein n=1 Tax=Mesorhizobium zhangyense TaxID=1776730 RepID=A0A7C9VAG7_9HYPH|nr:FHA domain-containing protein [Mesorhizobium zhangyense]NGN43923.1 FHA domain-containing protein [Mesorhizobium zhangyense]
MRLELKQKKGTGQDAAAQRWYFERGRRTIGRSSDCDWQVPDTTRSVSKLHCTIERDREGFLLRDESANGTRVDGVLVLEGETARLSDSSQLEFGGFAFSVAISGEKDHEVEDPEAGLALSDENLTISAILADIAPGGQSANGILRGRDSEDWSSPIPIGSPRRKGETAPSSRNVEIGWSGPPATTGMSPILPTDWNEDLDYSNRLEHSAAPHVSVPTARSRKQVDVAEQPAASASVVVKEGHDDTHSAPTGIPESVLLPRIEALLDRCEEAAGEAFAALDIDPAGLSEMPDLFGTGREEATIARLENLLARQVLLATAIEGLLKEASHAFEPRVIEARVDAEPRKLPWRNDRSYWQAYRQNFETGGASLSVREFFRNAVLRALGQPEEDAPEVIEKVKRSS